MYMKGGVKYGIDDSESETEETIAAEKVRNFEKEEREEGEREEGEREESEPIEKVDCEQRERDNAEIDNTCPICYDDFNESTVNLEIVVPNRLQYYINNFLTNTGISNREDSITINRSNVTEARNLLNLLRRQPVQIHRQGANETKHKICRSCVNQMLSDQDSINRSFEATNGNSPFACPTCRLPMDENVLNEVSYENRLMNNITNAITEYEQRRNNTCSISGGKKSKRMKNTKKNIKKKSRRKKPRKKKTRKKKIRRKN